ncbi:MAG: tetratricopeptide repeat protein [Candidatus Fibromonas sp.]|jgi:tol-pal system protein YbgF|nr:tetratricopeptide repeat protein [Candidatus Fibromonas sp.]
MHYYLFLLISLLIISCAPAEKAIPPGVDMFKVEATANEALTLAKTDSAQIAALAPYLEYISKRIDLLDSISTSLPITVANENQLQIALLREEVTFLRRFLENQDKVPLINPSRKQLPEAPGPFPPEYDKAQYLFSQKNYEAAANQFEKVTVLYPKSDWADDAWYWAGEAQMALGNYALAISAFEKVFFYPESVKQVDAQFQIGVCLIRMGNLELAKNALRKVQEFYPRSPRALQAQTELNKLK